MTPPEITAAEVGPHKAATILAALQAAGWQLTPHNPTPPGPNCELHYFWEWVEKGTPFRHRQD